MPERGKFSGRRVQTDAGIPSPAARVREERTQRFGSDSSHFLHSLISSVAEWALEKVNWYAPQNVTPQLRRTLDLEAVSLEAAR
jgi:hypothetical protein